MFGANLKSFNSVQYYNHTPPVIHPTYVGRRNCNIFCDSKPAAKKILYPYSSTYTHIDFIRCRKKEHWPHIQYVSKLFIFKIMRPKLRLSTRHKLLDNTVHKSVPTKLTARAEIGFLQLSFYINKERKKESRKIYSSGCFFSSLYHIFKYNNNSNNNLSKEQYWRSAAHRLYSRQKNKK